MLKRIMIMVVAFALALSVYADDRPATQPSGQAAQAPIREDFPFKIAFEQGVSKYEPGDQITITEVRGTSNDMQSGICRISGTFTLASQDEATLAASVTARSSADGVRDGPQLRRRQWGVEPGTKNENHQGAGDVHALSPGERRGVAASELYGRSSDFGGTYIGTGESVLRRWWGT